MSGAATAEELVRAPAPPVAATAPDHTAAMGSNGLRTPRSIIHALGWLRSESREAFFVRGMLLTYWWATTDEHPLAEVLNRTWNFVPPPIRSFQVLRSPSEIQGYAYAYAARLQEDPDQTFSLRSAGRHTEANGISFQKGVCAALRCLIGLLPDPETAVAHHSSAENCTTADAVGHCTTIDGQRVSDHTVWLRKRLLIAAGVRGLYLAMWWSTQLGQPPSALPRLLWKRDPLKVSNPRILRTREDVAAAAIECRAMIDEPLTVDEISEAMDAWRLTAPEVTNTREFRSVKTACRKGIYIGMCWLIGEVGTLDEARQLILSPELT